MRGWVLILMNPVITYGMFEEDEFKNILSKSQESHCNLIYFAHTDMDLLHKLQSIYKEDASRLRNVFETFYFVIVLQISYTMT